jgi:hypothetical protein
VARSPCNFPHGIRLFAIRKVPPSEPEAGPKLVRPSVGIEKNAYRLQSPFGAHRRQIAPTLAAMSLAPRATPRAMN